MPPVVFSLLFVPTAEGGGMEISMTEKGGMTAYDRKHKKWLFAKIQCGT